MYISDETKATWAYMDQIRANSPEVMLIKDMIEALKKDQFTFEFLGHIDPKEIKWMEREVEFAKKEIIRRNEFYITYHNEHITAIEKALAEGKPVMRKIGDKEEEDKEPQKTLLYHKDRLNFVEKGMLSVGDSPDSGLSGPTFHCFKCGVEYPWVIKSATVMTLGPSYKMYEERKTDCTCPLSKGLKPPVVKIDVPTGVLVFSNFFDDRKTTDKKEDECDCFASEEKGKTAMEIFEPKDKWGEFSLNSFLGRVNLAKHYATKFNIAYGQMGNMSITIYINRTKDQILIASVYVEDCEPDTKEYKQWLKYKRLGFRKIGEISLEMWRWMAADKSILDQYEIPLKKEGDRFGVKTVKVKKGKWKVTHYYDADRHSVEDNFVYSKLELVK